MILSKSEFRHGKISLLCKDIKDFRPKYHRKNKTFFDLSMDSSCTKLSDTLFSKISVTDKHEQKYFIPFPILNILYLLMQLSLYHYDTINIYHYDTIKMSNSAR
jgi:hypothetical protein